MASSDAVCPWNSPSSADVWGGGWGRVVTITNYGKFFNFHPMPYCSCRSEIIIIVSTTAVRLILVEKKKIRPCTHSFRLFLVLKCDFLIAWLHVFAVPDVLLRGLPDCRYSILILSNRILLKTPADSNLLA